MIVAELLMDDLVAVLLCVEQRETLRWSHVSRTWLLAAGLAIVDLDISAIACSGVLFAQIDHTRLHRGFPQEFEVLMRQLRRLPSLRRLQLRRAEGMEACALEALLGAAVGVTEVDVVLALPMKWPAYNSVQQRHSRVYFVDTLSLEPSPELSPNDVVVAQAYALHAGRPDICFRFASTGNQAVTGPVDRFRELFSEPSRYAVMNGCSKFELVQPPIVNRSEATCLVLFERWSDAQFRLFQWVLSRQADGCWATDSVLEASSHEMVMNSLI